MATKTLSVFAYDLGDEDFPPETPGDFDKMGAEQDMYYSVRV